VRATSEVRHVSFSFMLHHTLIQLLDLFFVLLIFCTFWFISHLLVVKEETKFCAFLN